jgi:transposase
LKRQPTEVQKEDKLKRLRILMDLWCNDEIDLRFADESGFSLQPSIPYGWLPIGKQTKISTEKTRVMNVFGLMSPDNELMIYETDKTINAEFIKVCLDDFANECFKKDKLTVVVWDNATWHTAQLIKDNIPRWEAKGLFLFQLPVASPHLNKIETLWRKIKYEWLQVKDFLNVNSLHKALHNIFNTFGQKEFNINFTLNY